jgi:flavodoxin
MKCLIVYVSVEHKNTEKVAKALADALGADVVEAKDADPANFTKYDLIGFGSGIYMGKFHARLLKLVDGLPQTKAKTFIFSSSGRGKIAVHKDLRKILEGKGYRVVGDFACKGWDTYGWFKFVGGINRKRPNEKDLNGAREFAKKLIV